MLTRDNQIAETESGVKVFFSGNVAASDFLAVNLEPAGSTPGKPDQRRAGRRADLNPRRRTGINGYPGLPRPKQLCKA